MIENICDIYKDIANMKSQVLLIRLECHLRNEVLFSVEVSENKDVTFF